jgi:hypothetical protein
MNMPNALSKRIARMNFLEMPGLLSSPASISSSTSSDACQKNMYGEIVVPATPTRMKRNSKFMLICGRKVARRIVPHGSCTMNTTAI